METPNAISFPFFWRGFPGDECSPQGSRVPSNAFRLPPTVTRVAIRRNLGVNSQSRAAQSHRTLIDGVQAAIFFPPARRRRTIPGKRRKRPVWLRRVHLASGYEFALPAAHQVDHQPLFRPGEELFMRPEQGLV